MSSTCGGRTPGFGQVFTDHMITARWSAERGWHDGALEPYGPFTLDPATSVFHYGQEFFEGLKAYRQDNGSIVDVPAAGQRGPVQPASARRMAMPELPEETFVRLSSCWSPRTGSGCRPARATACTCGRS
jgi:branched-chain amino acid aminotransferase